jgi:CheY-like chemotaxis protein
MKEIIIIEDSISDAQRAARLLETIGAANLRLFRRVDEGIDYLNRVASGEIPCPRLILLDLEFGRESGFEVLRFCNSHSELKDCRVVVWTVMGSLEKKICKYFGVKNVLSKDDDEKEILQALKDELSDSGETHGSGSVLQDNSQ